MKKGIKLLSVSLIFVLLTFSLTGCGNNETKGDGDFHIQLRLSHVFNPVEQLSISMDWVAERIYERTNGAVEIITFPQGQIQTGKYAIDQVLRGANFISVEDPSNIGHVVPDFSALVGPFLYESFEEYVQMVRTDLVQEMKDRAYEEGIKVLALDFIFGFRNVISDKVITSPEDMRGLRIRTPPSALFIDTFNAIGSVVTPLTWGETLPALQQGVIGAIEGSEFTNIGNRVFEISNHVALTRHFLGTCGVFLSTEVWESIPEQYQEIILEEFEKGAAEMVRILTESHSDVVDQLKAYGVQFNEVNTDAFRAATRPVFDTFPGLTPGIFEKLQDELTAIRQRLN